MNLHSNYRFYSLLLGMGIFCSPLAAQEFTYQSLDQEHPIELSLSSEELEESCIYYNGQRLLLDERTFLLDGRLTEEEAALHPSLFRTFQEAVAELEDGTEEYPMKLYIAPYVYWIDNPDDGQVRLGKEGREPFGMVVTCHYLHLIGLNPNPENTVLASARGQTQGAVGNFTMFDFWGDGLFVKNLTLGNYCNVDLDYPLEPALGRPRKNSAVTQAHIAYCHGDKVWAQNVRFISRLNMNPLSGARRLLLEDCHLEMTDDALAGNGLYLNCSFHFYGQRPFWRSDMGGAIFLNCDFYLFHSNPRTYFCKAVGPVSVVDSRFHSSTLRYVGWAHQPTDWLRCYQSNVTLAGQPYVIGAQKPYNTLSMEQHNQLAAYKVVHKGDTLYNSYNLLRGEDDWDPLQVKERIIQAGLEVGREYAAMGTCLQITPLQSTLQTGGEPLQLTAHLLRHNNFLLNNAPVHWRVEQGFEKLVRLSDSTGYSCQVEATNHADETQKITVIAYTDDGLECATELTVLPAFLQPPTFVQPLTLTIQHKFATLNYELDLAGRRDESIITWYRAKDAAGSDAIPVALSRFGMPFTRYSLQKEDVGYYLIASVQPKHLRCLPGEELRVITLNPIDESQVAHNNLLETDFSNLPTANQPLLLPGFWSVGGYKPLDTAQYDWVTYPEKEYWHYGKGLNGGEQRNGLLQLQRGARLLYTPLQDLYGDMELTLVVDPCKTAGQGFGSATGQYMDICIKFDTQTLTGYALRIIRTTKFSNAVDFLLVKYEAGVVTPISSPVSTICYRTNCTIQLKVVGSHLQATAFTTTPLPIVKEGALQPAVELEATIVPNSYGGIAIQHTGSWGESATLLNHLQVEWK